MYTKSQVNEVGCGIHGIGDLFYQQLEVMHRKDRNIGQLSVLDEPRNEL